MNLKEKIFEVSEKNFEEIALEVFYFQATTNLVYQKYLEFLRKDFRKIDSIEKIPFLPIEFFKSHKIISGNQNFQTIFYSSGTTNQNFRSSHFVSDISLYEKSFVKSFEKFYGSPQKYLILPLLPSYAEREGSSLIFMMEKFLESQNEKKFYLYNFEELVEKIETSKNEQVLLFGVSFALLDFATKYKISLPKNSIVMETGGMKGRRKELIRKELHEILCSNFKLSQIHSEYGMTELLSQAYSKGEGKFFCPDWMKVKIRNIYSPFEYLSANQNGGINVIDLANLYSCSFIETQDLGKNFEDGSFEVLGRFDNSETRGCNLLVEI